MGNISLSQEELIEIRRFNELVDDIRLVYCIYVDDLRIKHNQKPFELPDTFTLTYAFSLLFPDVKFVKGGTFFIGSIDEETRSVDFEPVPHFWLEWRGAVHATKHGRTCIIDVVPVDGLFGVSFPQAVIQSESRKRFFAVPSNPLPLEWSLEEKIDKDRAIGEVEELLRNAIAKVPS